MAKKQAPPPANRLRTVTPQSSGAVAARAEAHAPKKRFDWNFVKFFREVRAEARKITWPSRRETWITTVMVMIMVVVTSIFFLAVDAALGFGVTQLLSFGNPGQ
jgi:preprotein translocase subunit SecE